MRWVTIDEKSLEHQRRWFVVNATGSGSIPASYHNRAE
jgi:hypothetical protein